MSNPWHIECFRGLLTFLPKFERPSENEVLDRSSMHSLHFCRCQCKIWSDYHERHGKKFGKMGKFEISNLQKAQKEIQKNNDLKLSSHKI